MAARRRFLQESTSSGYLGARTRYRVPRIYQRYPVDPGLCTQLSIIIGTHLEDLKIQDGENHSRFVGTDIFLIYLLYYNGYLVEIAA